MPFLEKSRLSDPPQSTEDMHAPLAYSVTFPQLPTAREVPLIFQDWEELKLSVATFLVLNQGERRPKILLNKPLLNTMHIYIHIYMSIYSH